VSADFQDLKLGRWTTCVTSTGSGRERSINMRQRPYTKYNLAVLLLLVVLGMANRPSEWCYASSVHADDPGLEAAAMELGASLGALDTGRRRTVSEVIQDVESGWRYVVSRSAVTDPEVSFQLIGHGEFRAIALRHGFGAVVTQVPGPLLPAWSFVRGITWVRDEDRVRALEALEQVGVTEEKPDHGTVTLYMRDVPLGTVLLELQVRTGLTFCYEDHYFDRYATLEDTPLMSARVSIAFDSIHVEEALQILSTETGKFVWSRSGAAVNIIAPTCLNIPKYPMNRVLRQVRFDGSPRGRIQGLHGLSAVGVHSSGWTHKAQATQLLLHNVTVREFLNLFCASTGAYWYSLYRQDKQRLDLYIHQCRAPDDIVTDIRKEDPTVAKRGIPEVEMAEATLIIDVAEVPAFCSPGLMHVVTRPSLSGHVTQSGMSLYPIGAICAVATLGVLVLIIRKYRKGPGSRPGHGDGSGDANVPSTGPARLGSPTPMSDDSSTSAGGHEDGRDA
jgi:hypothetical protein